MPFPAVPGALALTERGLGTGRAGNREETMMAPLSYFTAASATLAGVTLGLALGGGLAVAAHAALAVAPNTTEGRP